MLCDPWPLRGASNSVAEFQESEVLYNGFIANYLIAKQPGKSSLQYLIFLDNTFSKIFNRFLIKLVNSKLACLEVTNTLSI